MLFSMLQTETNKRKKNKNPSFTHTDDAYWLEEKG